MSQQAGFSTFSTTKESEIRYEIKKSVLTDALQEGLIKIKDRLIIEQKWIMDGDLYRGRIRKTRFFNSPENDMRKLPFKKYVAIAERLGVDCFSDYGEIISVYEHTVKHTIGKSVDLEITTTLPLDDYAILDALYKNIPTQKKTRLVLHDVSGEYEDYIITADIPEDKPDICWIEFEAKNPPVDKEFNKPEWIKDE
jgi:hypothetical protein